MAILLAMLRPGRSDGRPIEPLLLFAITMLLTLVLVGPMMTITDGSSANVLGTLSGEGSTLRQVLYMGVAGLIFVSCRPTMRPMRLLAVPVPIVIALAYCWLTLTWSVVPGIGARRLVLTTITIWSVFVAVNQVGYERSIFLLRLALVGALAANFAAVLLVPAFGIHQANEVLDKNLIGDWRGIMMQKNITGAATAALVLVFVFDARRIPFYIRLPVLGAALFMLQMSGSRTALGMCMAAAGIGFVYRFYKARHRALLIGTLMFVIALLSTITNFIRLDKIPNLKDPRTLSGRLDVWDVVLRYSEDHKMLGSGYGSFWNVGAASPVYRYGTGWVVNLAQGHDGYLDLLATIGLPGLVIVIMATIALPILRLLASRAATGGRGALVISVIMFCVGQNATESTLFDRDAIPQVLLMFMLALLVEISPDVESVVPFGAVGARRRLGWRWNGPPVTRDPVPEAEPEPDIPPPEEWGPIVRDEKAAS